MTGNDLPDGDQVVRYAKPRCVHTDGKVDGSAFCLRPDDRALSVNWLESFSGLTKNEQLAKVRKLSRLKMREGGRLAELDVGKTKQHVRSELESIRFVHRPLSAEDDYEADPSHSEIAGLPPGDSDQAALVGDMIAECIENIHPALA